MQRGHKTFSKGGKGKEIQNKSDIVTFLDLQSLKEKKKEGIPP